MNNDKFDKMMHSYCNRDVEQFEFVEKKHTVKKTAVVAAALVVAVLVSVFTIPAYNKPAEKKTKPTEVAQKPTDVIVEAKRDNCFFLSASSSETEDTVSQEIVEVDIEHLYSKGFYINGQNIEKVRTYSENGKLAIAYCASKYNVTDRYHYENFPYKEGVPDPLLVIPNIKNSDGEYTEVYPDSAELSSVFYSCVDIVDINRHDDFKHIGISCIPIDENGNPLDPEDFPEGYCDTMIVEVTYLNGEVQTRSATVTFGDDVIAFDLNPHF